MKFQEPLVFELLNKSHDRSQFSCGSSQLDDYLTTRAGQEFRQNIAFSYMMRVKKSQRVMGFYTLSATSVPLNALPDKIAKLTRYDVVPAVLIGRLAVDESLQGLGVGKLLMIDALRRISKSADFAILVVVVDPIDSKAISFYQRFGFLGLKGAEGRMFLPFMTIKNI